MQVPKPSEADKAAFLELVPDGHDVVVRPMFGNLAAFVNGNMFMGLFGSTIGVKLDDAERAELLAVEGAGPFGPEERPMGGYVALPQSWSGTATEAAHWVSRSLALAASLPARTKKKR